jgi:hypothetical protein
MLELLPDVLPDLDLVITIDHMTKKKKKRPVEAAGPWKGDAVEKGGGNEAERGAERAEGNGPVRADAESERLRHPDFGAEPSHGNPRPSREELPEEDTSEVAEAHMARDEKEQPPRGKI